MRGQRAAGHNRERRLEVGLKSFAASLRSDSYLLKKSCVDPESFCLIKFCE